MSDERLPVHIDPIRMAETRRLLEGKVALAEMTRLADVVQDNSGEVTVSLEFGSDAEGIRYMHGHIDAEVGLLCQRCLEPMRYRIESEFSLGLVRSRNEAEALPSHYEPLLLDGNPLFLRDVIEDELLLALPIVAMHPQEECGVQLDGSEQAETEQPDNGEEAKDNPFSLLAGLKTDRKL